MSAWEDPQIWMSATRTSPPGADATVRTSPPAILLRVRPGRHMCTAIDCQGTVLKTTKACKTKNTQGTPISTWVTGL